MVDGKKLTAIVLSAGKGLRMGSDIPKQYLMLEDKPVLYYALKAFQDSIVDEIVIVAAEEYFDYINEEIVCRYGFSKVKTIVKGGEYRFNSVYNGLVANECDYVFIHDGARPLVTPEMVEKLYENVKLRKAVIAACPAKDTIKRVEENGLVVETPDRSSMWQVQTPQVFDYTLVKGAYDKLIEAHDISATDDAMVVEKYAGHSVYLVDTGYKNIKITTPEDLIIAKAFL